MIGEKLKEIREKNGMNKKEFAQYLGLKYTTYNNYETEAREPASDFLILISEKFDVSIDYLLGLKEESDILHSYPLKSSEYEHIQKYRLLDPPGKEHVDTVLEWEVVHQKAISEKNARIAEMEVQPVTIPAWHGSLAKEISTAGRIIQYFQCPASAGTGQVVFDDAPVDRIEIPDIQKYKRVSYAVSVNGDSMEPLYDDGDILLIEPTCELSIGEIGIFIVGSEAFVKELGDGELISLNADYNNIPLTEDSKCMGRVVGKFEK